MNRDRLAVLVAVLLGIGLRAAWPAADPPPDLSWSGGILTDPLANTLPARYGVEHGDWTRVRIPERLVYPLLNGAAWTAWSALGPTRTATHFLAIAIGLGAIGALGAALRRGPGPRAAVLGVAFAALAYWNVMFSRVLVAEGIVAALLAAAAFLTLRGGTAALVGAGAIVGVAGFFGKALAFAFLPGFVAFLWMRAGPRALGPPALGGALAAIAWLFLILLPHHTELLDWTARTSLGVGAGTGEWLGRLWLSPFTMLRDSWMIPQMPLLSVVAAWFVLATVTKGGTLRHRIEDGSALFALWLLGAALAYALLPYRAPRYFVPLAIPLVACAATQLATPATTRLRGVARFALSWFVAFGGLELARHLERRLGVNPTGTEPISVLGEALLPIATHVGASAALGALVFLASRRMPRGNATALIVAIVVVNLAQWARWAANRSYTIEDAQESLAAIVGPEAVIGGGYAPVLTLGSGRLAVPQFGSWEDAAARAESGLTHVLLAGAADRDVFERRFPEVAGRLHRIQRWPVRGAWVSGVELYRLPPPTEGPAYEPTGLERAIAAVREEHWTRALGLLESLRADAGAAPVPDLLSLEADCLWRLGRREEARARLVAAVERRPFDPVLHTNLGILAWHAGDHDSARDHWIRAVRLDPRNPEVRELLRKVAG